MRPMTDSPIGRNRRDFLTGKSALDRIREAIPPGESMPSSGHTVRLSQRAMACDFSVIMNAGIPHERVRDASHILDLVAELEQQMSVYRDDSELTELNQLAASQPIEVESRLFALLSEARRISERTNGAFDPTSGPVVALWRACREESRIPTQDEIDRHLELVGMEHIAFNEPKRTVAFDREGVELNLGGIGKGYAPRSMCGRVAVTRHE